MMSQFKSNVLFTIILISISAYIAMFHFSRTHLPVVIKFGSNYGTFYGKHGLNLVQELSNIKSNLAEKSIEHNSEILKEDQSINQNRADNVLHKNSNHVNTIIGHLDQIGSGKQSNSNFKAMPRKKIVLYHIYHTMLKWQAKKVDTSKCYFYKNCDIIHQGICSTQPIDADAVVFQGNNMPKIRPLRMSHNQAFVYLNIESPQYLQLTQLGNSFFNNFFNWTMTYRRDSDITYLYGSVIPVSMAKTDILKSIEMGVLLDFKNDTMNNTIYEENNEFSMKNYTKIFRKKTETAVWFNSHCGTASRRERYVELMQNHISVDIFGRCSNRTNVCPKTVKNCLNDIPSTYKFFLAFENSICEDYITEKVFNWFNKDIILVVRGSRRYKSYLPEGTFIDTDDFETPEHLAKYLSHLGSNEEEYIKILKRKDRYITISGEEFVQLSYCNLCYRLNNLEKFRKPARPLQQWWSNNKCKHPTDIVLR